MPTANLAPCGLSDNTTACEVRRGPSPVTEAHAHAFIASEAEDCTDEEIEDPEVLRTHRALFPLPAPAGGWFVAEPRAVTSACKHADPGLWVRAQERSHELRAELRANKRATNRATRVRTADLNGPNRKGEAIEGGCEAGVGRAVRADLGTRRTPAPPNPSTHHLASPLASALSVGTIKASRSSVNAHLPVGIRAVLPRYGVLALDAAVLDVVHLLSVSLGEDYYHMSAVYFRNRYGRPRLPSGRVWAWDVVRDDLLDSGVIEGEENAQGTLTYRVSVKGPDGKKSGGRAMSYRLTSAWRSLPRELVPRGAGMVLPPPTRTPAIRDDGTLAVVHPWLESSLSLADYDYDAAVLQILATVGAVVPATLDHASIQLAIAVGNPSDEVLADCDLWRKSNDKRTPLAIARAQALGQFDHIYRWRVEGLQWCYRDSAGHRLHSAVTCLASDLRKFLTIGGEELVTVDCVNSQMIFIAEAARRAYPRPDCDGFYEMCAAGAYYEQTYLAVHGVLPTAEQRNRWKREIMKHWLFCNAHEQHNSLAGQALARRWPSVHLWMVSQKLENNRDLPCAMQRRESSVWIDTIAPRFADAGIPLVTIHDSAMVPRSRADEALEIVKCVYHEAGLRAKFKVT